MLVGFHAPIAGGLYKAVERADAVGAKAVAFFTRAHRSWKSSPLKAEDAARFKAECAKRDFAPGSILPHGSYLTNLGGASAELREKTLTTMIDEVQRCHDLGLTLYNFHPGSAVGCSKQEAIISIAKGMDLVMDRVPHVMLVIENMAGQGNVIGSTFEEIKSIMDLVQDKHKSRVGVCLDTAHCHGAGLDCTTPAAYAAMMAKFDAIIGMKHLRGMHLNDSKANLGSKRDLHQYLGRGHIGMEAFRSIMNDKRLTGIPLILETPSHDDKDTSVYKGEIAMLYSLIGTLAGAPCALPHLPAGALEANMDADGKIPGKRKKEEAEGEEGEAQPKKGKKGDAPEEGAGAPAPAAKKAGKGVAK